MAALSRTLDDLGVGHGEEFVIFKAEKATGVDTPSLGPYERSSGTSRQAAVDNFPRSGTQRARVLEFIAAAGPRGCTRDEVTAGLGLPDSSTDPRVWELLRGGFVEPTGETRETRAGSHADVLRATAKGLGLEEEAAQETTDPWEEPAAPAQTLFDTTPSFDDMIPARRPGSAIYGDVA